MGKLVMGYWDCPVCGNKGIPGIRTSCPSCGRARGEVQFYMKDAKESYTADELNDLEQLTEEQEKEMGRNPDWYCSFCNSLNRDNAKVCASCGASREDSEANYFDVLKRKQEKEQAEQDAQPKISSQAAPKSKKGLMILLVIAAAIIGLVVWMTRPKTQTLQVTGQNWERTVSIEQLSPNTDSSWNKPSGDSAVLVDQKQELTYETVIDYVTREVERTRKVFDHYNVTYRPKDLGNGSFDMEEIRTPVYRDETYTTTEQVPVPRQVPVYKTKYYFRRWVEVRTAAASGEGHENVRDPEFELQDGEREGARNGIYTFTVTNDKGEAERWSLNQAAWETIRVGDSVQITMTNTGGNPHLTAGDGTEIPLKRVQ